MPTPTARTTRSTTVGDADADGGTPLAGETRTATGPSLPNLSFGGLVDPKRVLWLGGLAALGVIGVLEWPVVAAVGVGSYVAERFAKDDAAHTTTRS